MNSYKADIDDLLKDAIYFSTHDSGKCLVASKRKTNPDIQDEMIREAHHKAELANRCIEWLEEGQTA